MSIKWLGPLAAVVFLVAILAISRVPGWSVLQRAVSEERTLELTVAWPIIWLHQAADGWQQIARASPSTGPGTPFSGRPPTFGEWQAVPVEARWAEYGSPTWRSIRLTTRIITASSAVLVMLLAVRIVGRPLAGVVWFLGSAGLLFHEAKPTTSHGSARWARPAELRRRRPRPNHADLLVGRVGRHAIAIPEERQYEHTLLVAPNGAGKTSGLIIPNLLREPGARSLIVTDPKRELLRLTSPRLRQVYGDRVWALDFLDPAISTGYNPLASVTDAASADLFAQTWVANTGTSQEPFWGNAARTLIGAAALHLVQTEEVLPPLVALVDFLCGQPAEQVRALLAASPAPEARRLAQGFLVNLEKNERLLGSVFSELPPRFSCLNLGSVRQVTAVQELDLAALAREPGVLYLPLTLDHTQTLAPLTACFFRDLFATLARLATARRDGHLPVPVFAYLDEFGTIGRVPQFAARMATVRSMGLGLFLVVQSQAQLLAAYGQADADTILANANTKLCLAGIGQGLSANDATFFSNLAGRATVLSRHQGRSRDYWSPLAGARKDSTVVESQRQLITADELRTKAGHVLLIAGQEYPVLARQRRYYDDRALVTRLPSADTDPLASFRRWRACRPLPLVAASTLAFDDDERATGLGLMPDIASWQVETQSEEVRLDY